MEKVRKSKNDRLNENKIIVLGLILFVLLTAVVTIPTLASYKNRNLSQTVTVWDGEIASDYRSGAGTEDSPYVIANGAELAFFAQQLQTNNYEGKHFILSNNIVLNDGIFNYDKVDGIKYKKDNSEIEIVPNEETELIKKFQHLDKFKGTFDGNYHTIFGLYIDEAIDGQNALFTNLEGNVKNLYVENSIIYGGNIVAGIASKTNNATLTNILYNGYVISNQESSNGTVENIIDDITFNVEDLVLTDNIVINEIGNIPGLITEVILSGNYSTTNVESTLKINGQDINIGDFEINLGNKLLTTIPLNYQINVESDKSDISLTKLKYQVKYTYSNAAGIVSLAENTTLKNIINKSHVSAGLYSSGIVNFANGTTMLKNIYNTGKIESANISSGLISGINQNKLDTTIINSYNAGELSSNINSMIGNIENNSGNITLENVFNAVDSYAINLIDNSNVTINNSYVINDKFINLGASNGEFFTTSLENLEDKTFVLEKLQYQEFNEDENSEDSVWVFEDNKHPKLFMDYQIADISIGEYKWDKYKNTLNTLNFSKKIVINIEATNQLNTIKEIYYYISNEKEVLTKSELDEIDNFTKYENIVEINTDGVYVIYAKIVDNDESVTYINTDLIMLDLTAPDVTISTNLEDVSWNDFREELDNYYIDEEINITINSEDSLSKVKETYYYTSSKLLSKEEIENIENWKKYEESILITNKKTIVYAKVVDNCGNITYANSDLIIINGYTLNSLYPGMNGEEIDNLYITDNSSVSLNFSYQDAIDYESGNKHQIISNVLLPENTIITIIDKLYNKVYIYKTTNANYDYDECLNDTCEAIYDFELFNEVGTTNKFQESYYTGLINEEFIINIDFKNTEITENIENIIVSLRLFNEEENKIKNTIQGTLKHFNVIFESDAYFNFETTFEDTIKYSENEEYVIDLNTKLNYKYLDNHKIYDTTLADKNLGLAIKMLSSTGSIVERNFLKNISFMIGDKKYSPSSDGIVRISLENGFDDIVNNLIIETSNDNSKLETGDYKFMISLYTGYDVLYSNEFLNSIEIPVYVGENTYKNDINFNVIMNSEDKIITTPTNEFDFSFLISDNKKENTNLKVSLYKKDKLEPFDQNYTLVNLDEYLVDNILEASEENIYYASKNVNNNDVFKLNLNTNMLEKTGYMFVFELFEDNEKVFEINKKFVVK